MDALNIIIYSGAAITIAVQTIQNNYLKNKNSKLKTMESNLFLENAELKKHRAHLNFVISEQAETISDIRSQMENQFINVDYLKNILAKYQRLNNELCDKIDTLIDKRKFNGKQKKAVQTKTEKPIYEFKTKTN
jgi:predicted RNase H-like nuclease (RuvC/YqgF family)